MSMIGYVNGIAQRARREAEFQAHREWREGHFDSIAAISQMRYEKNKGETREIEGRLQKYMVIYDYLSLSPIQRNKQINVRRFLRDYFKL